MANFLKRIFVKNIDNVDNQEYFTEELKKGDETLDSTLYIEGERLTVRKDNTAKKNPQALGKEKPKPKKTDEDLEEIFLEGKERNKEEDKKTVKPKTPEDVKKGEPVPTPVIEPEKEPVLPKERNPFEVNTEPKTEVKTEVPIRRQEEKKPVVNLQVNETVRKPEEVKKEMDTSPKIEAVKVVKDVTHQLPSNVIDFDKRIDLYAVYFEKRIKELEDQVHDYSDKIYKSEDKDEVDYYIKELYRILKEIDDLVKKLDEGIEIIKFDNPIVLNKEDFLKHYEYLTNKLDVLQKEYVNKEIETAEIKSKLIEETDKDKDEKKLEADRPAKEVEYFQHKMENDLYYITNIKKRVDEITETRERVQRTYVGVRRVLNTLANGLAVATMLPGPLAMLAVIGAQLRAFVGLAGQMVNPQYEEHRYEETIVTPVVTNTASLDDYEFYQAEKDLDEIIKDFDYLMNECYRLFNEDPKYKDLFDELKNIKAILDSQKQEIMDIQKTTAKQLILKREPIED